MVVKRDPLRTSPEDPFDLLLRSPVATSVQAPLTPCQAEWAPLPFVRGLPTGTPVSCSPRVPGLQPASSVELDAPVRAGSAWAKMRLVLMLHEGLQLLLPGDVSAALTARAASLGQARGKGEARARVKRGLGLFSSQRAGRQTRHSWGLGAGRGCQALQR